MLAFGSAAGIALRPDAGDENTGSENSVTGLRGRRGIQSEPKSERVVEAGGAPGCRRWERSRYVSFTFRVGETKAIAPGGEVCINGERLEENVNVVASVLGAAGRTVPPEPPDDEPEPEPEPEPDTAPPDELLLPGIMCDEGSWFSVGGASENLPDVSCVQGPTRA